MHACTNQSDHPHIQTTGQYCPNSSSFRHITSHGVSLDSQRNIIPRLPQMERCAKKSYDSQNPSSWTHHNRTGRYCFPQTPEALWCQKDSESPQAVCLTVDGASIPQKETPRSKADQLPKTTISKWHSYATYVNNSVKLCMVIV